MATRPRSVLGRCPAENEPGSLACPTLEGRTGRSERAGLRTRVTLLVGEWLRRRAPCAGAWLHLRSGVWTPTPQHRPKVLCNQDPAQPKELNTQQQQHVCVPSLIICLRGHGGPQVGPPDCPPGLVTSVSGPFCPQAPRLEEWDRGRTFKTTLANSRCSMKAAELVTPQHSRFCQEHTAQPSECCHPRVRALEPGRNK